MNYDYIRPELVAMLPVYRMCEDCFRGSEAVKRTHNYSLSGSHGNGGGVGYGFSPYLPDPSPTSENDTVRAKRYEQYLQRAVFYNVTRRTVTAMVGAVFARYPTFDLTGIEYLENDVSGSGISLAQQAKDAMTEVMLKGRVGLLADMPVNQEGVSKADMMTKGIRPTIKIYKAESIINWRTCQIGAHACLSLVVLSESYIKEDDGFKPEYGEQLLILRLNDDGYAESEIVRKADNSGWVSQGVNPITDNNGKQLDYIPFFFAGGDNNDADVDEVPIYDIAHLNIAHFVNAADLEESLHISGQPTLVISGLTQEWVDSNLTDGVSIGARSGLLLPQGGNAQLLQAGMNSALFEAMKHKEELMVTLGAKLISPQNLGQAKTATEAASDQASETSVLSNIAYNISDSYSEALKACADFAGVPRDNIVLTLNTNFSFNKMTSEQRQVLLQEWQAGAITWGEMRGALLEDEVAILENHEEAKQIINQEQGEMLHSDRL